ncbi:MAG: efflux RND transporter periplasmic adaptor subunit [Deltaproteobacteria bacterium]|nr:efflux RND transporter periplasmic adaptor subunit [Deltaproteobacteria bacterium]
MDGKSGRFHKTLPLIGGVVIFIVLILYMGGFFRTGLIKPGLLKTVETAEPDRTAYAAVEDITEWYEAVGTVRSRAETDISAQITGRILEIIVRPGDKVEKGDPMIYLDNRQLQAKFDQARQGLKAAKAKKEQAEQALVAAQAVFAQAEAQYNRIKTYFDQQAATKKDLEQAEASLKQAKAGVEQARKGVVAAGAGVQQAKEVVEEERVSLGYTNIIAHETGKVAKRLAEPGDLAWPGKSLLILYAPGALRLEAHVREGLIGLRLEAHVREGLIGKVLPGLKLRVAINALNATLEGTVEEVIPLADPLSRTFLVKVAIPAIASLYPGMFGRLLVPLDVRQAVVVPRNAVYRVGQMEVVKAEKDGRWCDCFVKTGKEIDGRVEILSGLKGNERIAVKINHNE